MVQRTVDLLFATRAEIIEPQRKSRTGSKMVPCLCCQKVWPMTSMDEDGCGLCHECLKP